MRVRVSNTLDDLASDLRHIATTARRDMAETVRDNINAGNRIARNLARKTAGAHGKHYHKAFSAEMHTSSGDDVSGEYGPDSEKPQGGMSFERGSRNQPAHHDIAKSADAQAPKFYRDVQRLPDRWFWPNG